MDRPFVVFNRRAIVIDRLGVPIAPPVSMGSSPSPATIQADDPSIVAVAASGELVGLRNGRTRLRTLNGEGSTLDVEVRAVDAIRIVPDRIEVEPGRSAFLEVRDAVTGELVPAEAAEWGSDAPARVTVLRGTVHAGATPGSTVVSVRYGTATAHAEVVVVAPRNARLTVSPPRARLRVGEVKAFQAFSADGPVEAIWTSADARVLAPLRGSLFQAVAVGRTTACAAAMGRKACSEVGVSP